MIRWLIDNILQHLSVPPERNVEHCMTARLAQEIEWLAQDRDDWKEMTRRALEERDLALMQRDACWRRLDERIKNDG